MVTWFGNYSVFHPVVAVYYPGEGDKCGWYTKPVPYERVSRAGIWASWLHIFIYMGRQHRLDWRSRQPCLLRIRGVSACLSASSDFCRYVLRHALSAKVVSVHERVQWQKSTCSIWRSESIMGRMMCMQYVGEDDYFSYDLGYTLALSRMPAEYTYMKYIVYICDAFLGIVPRLASLAWWSLARTGER